MALSPVEAYEKLVARSREVALLSSAVALSQWDQRVLLPPKGGEYRGSLIAYLATLRHDRFTAPEVGDWLAIVESGDLVCDPESDAAANTRELRHSYDRETKLPGELVAEQAAAAVAGEAAWVQAREQGDFALFAPALQRLVSLAVRVAEAVGYGAEVYDALIDEYEPGFTAAQAAEVLGGLRSELVPLVDRICGADHQPRGGIMARHYPVEAQDALTRAVLMAVGFDLEAGRIDTSVHAFSEMLGVGDTRLTTRYNPDDFREGLLGALHEAGHGLYNQGLDPVYAGTPLGSSVSHGIHESQARLWENAVGHSPAFWAHFFPQAQRLFPEALGDVPQDDFVFALNDVKRTFIRVDADEVTYNLHIMLRFELERELIARRLAVKDLPEAWNEGFARLFGVPVTDDRQGCLQDVHWSCGWFGYFPTYALGNIYAAQLWAKASGDLGDLERSFARGDFSALREWLRDNVHRHGSRYPAAVLVEKVTGQPPSSGPLLAYLRGRYEPMYRL